MRSPGTGCTAFHLPTPAVALEGILGAATGAEACYTRTCSPAHLAKNAAQRVTATRFALRREAYPGSVGVDPRAFIRVEVTRRGEDLRWKAIGGCGFDAKANPDTSGRKLIRNCPKTGAILCDMTGEGLDSEGGVLTVEALKDGPGSEIKFGGTDGVFQLGKVANAVRTDLHAGLVAQ